MENSGEKLNMKYSYWAKRMHQMSLDLATWSAEVEQLGQTLDALSQLPPAAVDALVTMAQSMRGKVKEPKIKDGLQARVVELVDVFLTKLEGLAAKGFNSQQVANFVIENLNSVERARFHRGMTYEGLRQAQEENRIERLSSGRGKTPATYRFVEQDAAVAAGSAR